MTTASHYNNYHSTTTTTHITTIIYTTTTNIPTINYTTITISMTTIHTTSTIFMTTINETTTIRGLTSGIHLPQYILCVQQGVMSMLLRRHLKGFFISSLIIWTYIVFNFYNLHLSSSPDDEDVKVPVCSNYSAMTSVNQVAPPTSFSSLLLFYEVLQGELY